MGIEVKLGSSEMVLAGTVGVMRQTKNVSAGRVGENGADKQMNDWQYHIEGCLGELAFSKHMGVYWSGALAFAAKDVGDWQVKTRPRHDWDLIVQKSTLVDDDKYVLLTGLNGQYQIQGWIYGWEIRAHHDEWHGDKLHNGRPAYFVPQEALRLDGIVESEFDPSPFEGRQS